MGAPNIDGVAQQSAAYARQARGISGRLGLNALKELQGFAADAVGLLVFTLLPAQAALLEAQAGGRGTRGDAGFAQYLLAAFAALPGAQVIAREAPCPAYLAPQQSLYLGLLRIERTGRGLSLLVAHLQHTFKQLARLAKFALDTHTFRQAFEHKGQPRAGFWRQGTSRLWMPMLGVGGLHVLHGQPIVPFGFGIG